MELSRESLQRILESSSIERFSFAELESLFLNEKQITRHAPGGKWESDPRNGDCIVYNASRRKRPHDNIYEKSADPEGDSNRVLVEDYAKTPAGDTAGFLVKNRGRVRAGRDSAAGDSAARNSALKNRTEPNCAICRGETTGVLDVADLSEGFTFINKNLYPAVYPHGILKGANKNNALGFHFLQWTSSIHGNDWHNMSTADCFVVMKRLAALEGFLFEKGSGVGDIETGKNTENIDRYVVIIKNYGKLVGGSLSHGHQQILYANVMPRALEDDFDFRKKHGETFSSFIIRENPANLTVKDYGNAVLLVPFFMKRPYHMLLAMKSTNKARLNELDEGELESAARGWHDASKAITRIMPELGRETAYNIVTHNGPGGGLYFEFLPYTQELGGLEKLGFYVCEGKTLEAAEKLKEVIR